MTRTAAHVLVETFDKHGVDLAYCVPGESYLQVVDAMIEYPNMKMIVCRHEGGAGFMALADAKITGKPGIIFVSRGPGVTNASIAIHTAKQDATPLIVFAGQTRRRNIGRGSLQEIDFTKTFSDMAKLVIDVREGALLGEAAARAFHVAQAGTPGPVVLVLPTDMLSDATDAPGLAPRPMPKSAPSAADMEAVVAKLSAAERPMVIVGSSLPKIEAAAVLAELSDKWTMPICTEFRRPHLFPNDHHNYGGYLGIRVPDEQISIMRRSDLLLVVGSRLGDTISQGYSFPIAPVPEQTMIQIYPDPAEIGRVWEPTIGMSCDPMLFLEALDALDPPAQPQGRRQWIDSLNQVHHKLAEWHPVSANDGVVFGAVVNEIKKYLRPDSVVTSDAGNFASWIHRYLSFSPEGEFVGALSGAMGGGVPSAVAGGLRRPDSQLVAFIGDGGVLMTGNELATAMQYNVPVKLFIANNSIYGTIRMHQARAFPGRPSSTELTNPDFAAWGASFGAKGLTIANDADVGPVVQEAMACDGPVVVEVVTSLNHLTAYKTLQDVEAEAAD